MVGETEIITLQGCKSLVQFNDKMELEEQRKDRDMLMNKGLTYLQAFSIVELAKEYQKPDRGKWVNNT